MALHSYLGGKPLSNDPEAKCDLASVFHDTIQGYCGMKVNDSDRLSFADTGGKHGLAQFLRLAKRLHGTPSTPDTEHALFFLQRLAKQIALDTGLLSDNFSAPTSQLSSSANPTGAAVLIDPSLLATPIGGGQEVRMPGDHDAQADGGSGGTGTGRFEPRDESTAFHQGKQLRLQWLILFSSAY